MAYEYEDAYSDGQGGIILQWKDAGSESKARCYLKITRMVTVELEEMADRKFTRSSEHVTAIQRLRKLLGIIE